jgi:hypothetical protein
MTELKPVILVRELPPARSRLRQHLPSIRDLIMPAPFAQESAVLSYLVQGVVCGIYNDGGLLFDVLQPQQRVAVLSQDNPGLSKLTIQPSLVLTNGTWVWPGVLPYYVAVYHLRLPALFLQFAEENHWKIDASAIDPGDVNWDAYDGVSELPQGANEAV